LGRCGPLGRAELAKTKTSVEPRIVEAGIELFSERGFHGVRQQDLVRGADTTLHSFYLHFADTKAVFDVVLDTVIRRALDLGKLALMILSQGKDMRDSAGVARFVIRQWYESLTLPTARLLVYAGLSKNKKWKRQVEDHLGGIIDLLVKTLAGAKLVQDADGQIKPEVAAKALIWTLLHFKINESESRTEKEQEQAVEEILSHWLHAFLAGQAPKPE